MKTLFEPLNLKNLTLQNRICVPPMVCFNWSDESGLVSDRHVAHYKAIAQGGPGLIIQEATCIDPVGRLADSQLGIWSDEHIPGLKRIVDAVHAEGVPILVQIHHAGIMGLTNPAPCPSNYVMQRRGQEQQGTEMTAEQIDQMRRNFTEAARRAQKAGYDGVELHGCHSYLLSQFLNKRVNRRSDRYGDGMVLVEEILKDVREATGPDFIVGIRLGVFEPGLADGIAHAKRLAELGIDFLDLSYGFGPESDSEKPADFPLADVIFGAGRVKGALKEMAETRLGDATGDAKPAAEVPVFAVYGIQSAEQAQLALELTGVDMIDVGRGVLVNYNWAKDAKEGRDTGKCLYCKTCMWRVDADKCAGRLLMKSKRGNTSWEA